MHIARPSIKARLLSHHCPVQILEYQYAITRRARGSLFSTSRPNSLCMQPLNAWNSKIADDGHSMFHVANMMDTGIAYGLLSAESPSSLYSFINSGGTFSSENLTVGIAENKVRKMLSGLSGLTSRQSANFPLPILSHSGSVVMEGASGQDSSGVGTSMEAKVITLSMEAATQIASRSAGCSGAESFLLKIATPFVQ